MALTKPRAYQIYDIDYKQATRVITVVNITLSGGAPSQVDGVNLSLNDRVLVIGQTNKAQNGIYDVDTVGSGSNGTWVRSGDTNTTGELLAGTIVMVTEGVVYADTQWKLITNDPITIGVSELVFEQNSAFAFGNVNANGTAVLANSVGSTLNLTAGDNISITGNNTSKTVTIGVTGISLNSISNGTSNVNVVSSGGNVTVGIAGTSNVAVFSSTGANITGTLGVSGNVTGGNLITAGQISATGTITTAAGTNSTGFAVGNGAVSNVGLGFFPTAGTRGDYAIRDYSNVTSTMYFDVGMGGSAAGEFQFRTSNAFTLLMRANSTGVYSPGVVTANGIVSGLELTSTQSSGDEGGQLNLAKAATNTTLAGNVIVDIYQNRFRIFENGGTNRGAFIDLTSCNASVGTNLLSGGGGTPGGSNTYVQFNDAGTFGGNGQFVFDKVTNLVTAGAFAGNTNGTGQNFKVGDDAWIGDINVADTIGLKGQQNGANCYIVFGNSDATGKLGRAGTGPLTYAGAFTATGNITGGNLSGTSIAGTLTTAAQTNITSVGTLSSLTVTANVAGGNLTTAGQVAATGNVSGGNLNVTGNIVDTGAMALITGGSGNISLAPNGTNTLVATTTGANVTGTLTATGNVSGGNLNVTGNIVDTGALTVITGSSGNISLAPNGTNTLVATTTGANVTGTLGVTGNVSGGNLTTAGQVAAVGNISGNFFIGNGSQLTGITSTPNAIVNGTSNVSISSSGGNVAVSVAGSSNVAVFSTGVLAVNGLITTPKTISVSGTLPADTNSQLISPITINTGVTITVPDSSTIYITP